MPKTIKTKEEKKAPMWIVRPDEKSSGKAQPMPTLKELLKKKNILI